MMAGSFRDRDMGGQFFVDPSALESARLYGHVFGASFYDINDEDYFVDP